MLWRLRQDAAKKFGKRFACGASVVKDASNKEEIDVQVSSTRPAVPEFMHAQRHSFLGGCCPG